MKLLEDLRDVNELINEGSMVRSTKKLKSILTEFEKGNKLIRMADRSPAGWNTVQEYLSDDLSSDSEDEKRIRSAESKALAKQKQQIKSKYLFIINTKLCTSAKNRIFT